MEMHFNLSFGICDKIAVVLRHQQINISKSLCIPVETYKNIRQNQENHFGKKLKVY